MNSPFPVGVSSCLTRMLAFAISLFPRMNVPQADLNSGIWLLHTETKTKTDDDEETCPLKCWRVRAELGEEACADGCED